MICLVGSAHAESPVRVAHAKELLGKSYRKSVVRKGEHKSDVAEFTKETIKRFLPKAYQKNSNKIAETLLTEAEARKLDPIFLVAVIQNESSFNPKMKGSFGEIGLMQIKPSTAAWIAKTHHIKYKNAASLYDPQTNIRIGAAVFQKLRNQFDAHSRLYLSAYNIGAKKVREMVSEKKIPKEYVMSVMKRYVAIYSALSEEGGAKDRSETAFSNVQEVTRKIASKPASKVATN